MQKYHDIYITYIMKKHCRGFLNYGNVLLFFKYLNVLFKYHGIWMIHDYYIHIMALEWYFKE